MKTLEFGFSRKHVCLDMPIDIFSSAKTNGQYLAKILDQPINKRVVDTEELGDGIRLLLNTKRAGNISNLVLKEDRCRQMTTAVSEVSGHASLEQQDPALTVRLGTYRINNGDRYGMDAQFKWPESLPEILQVAATNAMRETAQELKFVPKSLIAEVHAMIDRNQGITLETLPIASSSLDTDGNTYDPIDPVVELYGHNIYNHQMQLICLSGLIAITHV